MVHKCCVKGCKSVWSPTGSINFHGFPSDLDRRIQWLKELKLKSKYYSAAKICSKHFKRKDYDQTHKRLRLSAVPFYDQSLETETVYLQMPSSREMEKYSDEEVEEVKKKNSHSTTILHDTTFEENAGMSPARDVNTSTDEDEPIKHLKSRLTETVKDTNVEKKSNSQQSTGTNTSSKENIPEPKRQSLLMDMLLAPTKKPVFENNSIVSKFLHDRYEKKSEEEDSDDEIIMAHRSIQVKISTPRELRLRKKNKILAQKVSRQAKTIESMKSLIAKLKNNSRQTIREKNMIILPGNREDVSKMLKKIIKKYICRNSSPYVV